MSVDPATQIAEPRAPAQMGEGKGIRWGAILLSLPLICLNSLWLFANWGKSGYASGQSWATVVSLFYNVLFCQLLLMGINAVLRKLAPRVALRTPELVLIYTMLTIGSAMASHDTTQILWPMIAYSSWHATPENGWVTFQHALPDALTVKSKVLLKDYFLGGSTLYTWEHVSIWLKPVLFWTAIIGVLSLMMLFIVVLLSERWTKHEKLSCPIAQLPLAMMEEGGGFFRSRLMWIGFALTAAMSLMNGFHQLYAWIPGAGGTFVNLGSILTARPWSAIGHTPVAISPFGVGMAFFIPLDLSFSMWFFYVLHKLSCVAGDAAGLSADPRFPYTLEQARGAWLGLAMLAIWGSRDALKEQFRSAFYATKQSGPGAAAARTAFLGIGAGALILMGMARLIGVSPVMGLVYLILFLAVAIAIARIRAELGPPSHDVTADPSTVIFSFTGTRGIGLQTLTMFTLMNSLIRSNRAHVMPNMLEGFVMSGRRGVDSRKLMYGIVLAVIVGTLSSAWAHYHLSYMWGAANYGEHYQCNWFYDGLLGWSRNPTGADKPAIAAILGGVAMTFLLMTVRHQVPWCPLHPAGYALSLSTWNAGELAASILLGWLIKFIIMRYGGMRLYRQALPLFMGIVLGDLMMAACWSLLGISLGMPMYRFLA